MEEWKMRGWEVRGWEVRGWIVRGWKVRGFRFHGRGEYSTCAKLVNRLVEEYFIRKKLGYVFIPPVDSN